MEEFTAEMESIALEAFRKELSLGTKFFVGDAKTGKELTSAEAIFACLDAGCEIERVLSPHRDLLKECKISKN